MKVYVVTWGCDYEDTCILGVYSTRKMAENAIVKDKEKGYAIDWYDITELELDKEIK